MGYGSGPAARNLLVQDGFRLRLSDLTDGEPLRPGARHMGRMSWTRWGDVAAVVRYDLTTHEASGRLSLLYEVTTLATGEKTRMDYVIILVTTEQPGGGVRYWFWCDRGRAMATTLYMMPGSFVFASRAAFRRLSYRTQRIGQRDRALEKAQAIRASMGGSVNMFDEFPEKPPRMHWKTYARKRAEADAARGVSLALLSKHLERCGPLAKFAKVAGWAGE